MLKVSCPFPWQACILVNKNRSLLVIVFTGSTFHAGPWPPAGSISRRLYNLAIFLQSPTLIFFRSCSPLTDHFLLVFQTDLSSSGSFLNYLYIVFALTFFSHVLTILPFLFYFLRLYLLLYTNPSNLDFGI